MKKEQLQQTGISIPGCPAKLASDIVSALGGNDNLTDLDACLTRLRVMVRALAKVDKPALTGLGAAGIFEQGNHCLHVVFGTQSSKLKDEIKLIIG